jgi:hypothetical protein
VENSVKTKQLRTRKRVLTAVLAGCVALLSPQAPLAISPAQAQMAMLSGPQITAIQTQIANALAGINPALMGPARDAAAALALQVAAQNITVTYGAAAAEGISIAVAAAMSGGVSGPFATATIIQGAISAGMPAGLAIQVATVAAINAGGTPADIAAAAMLAAISMGVPDADIGTALANAATQLAGIDPAAAQAIAQTVANEGSLAMAGAFSTQIANLGGPPSLSSIATSNPTPPDTASRGNNVILLNNNNNNNNNGNGNGTGNGLPPPPPPCANPSCT